MESFIIGKISLSGAEVWPLVEGGKGIALSNGFTAGAFAAAGCVGTFSCVMPKTLDEQGDFVTHVFSGKTRVERHEEFVELSIEGSVQQAHLAKKLSGGNGRIHMNILWEVGGSQRIIEGILERTRGVIHGVTCGAGMPYKLAEIASKNEVYYYPIISSMRAFRALWKRAYCKYSEFLGGVVYEDPWIAGGHNGLSNSEDPLFPEKPFARVLELRKFMNSVGLSSVAIIMAGGVWNLSEWQEWFADNSLVAPIAFQFGTRPLLTKESPLSDKGRLVLSNLEHEDIVLNKFSPTGFYSSAVKNDFLQELYDRNDREVAFSRIKTEVYTYSVVCNTRGDVLFIMPADVDKINNWINAGFSSILKTPDSTIIFVSKERSESIRKDQINCVGCLSACKFSNWAENKSNTTGILPDPRSFCIRSTLHNVSTGNFDPQQELLFAGKQASRFGKDKMYSNGYIPSIEELIDSILKGK